MHKLKISLSNKKYCGKKLSEIQARKGMGELMTHARESGWGGNRDIPLQPISKSEDLRELRSTNRTKKKSGGVGNTFFYP